jgi:1,4-alpha-glucan branching enzyme
MKQSQTHSSAVAAHSLPVRFELTDPEAITVFIAGTFNEWQPDAKAMHAMGNHRWVREIMLPLGTHEYCFVVNGKFRPDPRTMETVANPFGGRNSILKVVGEPELVRYSTAEKLQQNRRKK